MHSWVFRNRARLRLVFGHLRPHALPAPPAVLPTLREGEGEVVRRKHYVRLRPMPRRAR